MTSVERKTRPRLYAVGPSGPSPEDVDGARLSLDQAFRRFAPYVAVIGLRMLGRNDEVDDLVQEVFLVAQRSLKDLRQPGAVKGWLATVAVRVAGQKLRKRRLRAWWGLQEAFDYDEVAATAADPEDRLLLARIYACLDRVPGKQRIAWSLRYIEGERLEHVALLCGCSLATAKRRIAAAQLAVAAELGND